jgi:protein-S-isoprenylcysteine O-methyltransferase Ste14
VHVIAGVAITVPAYCLWALARLQLGKSFAVRAQTKELVTRGLYAKIQNPVYVFNAIFLAGVFVFFGQPVWFLFFLILIPMQWSRIRNERRALEAKFGDAYREYRKRTWF